MRLLDRRTALPWPCWLLLAGVCLWIEAAEPASSERPLVLLVAGAAGEPRYQEVFKKQEALWRQTAEKSGAQVTTIGLEGPNNPESDADLLRLKECLDSARGTSATALWIVLIGHGTDNGREAKFNLRGPDFSAADLAGWLNGMTRPVVLVNTTSASGPFVKALAGGNRVVITATRSGSEQNFAHFGRFMAEAIGSPEADLDKDQQTSLLESFLMAARRTADFYKDEGRLATEHALVDDNGDGLGTPADWFEGVRAAKKAQGGGSVDGRRAHQIHLLPSAAEQELPPTARAKRDELELAVAALRDRKAGLPEADYYQELEGLLVQLARLYEPAREGAK